MFLSKIVVGLITIALAAIWLVFGFAAFCVAILVVACLVFWITCNTSQTMWDVSYG